MMRNVCMVLAAAAVFGSASAFQVPAGGVSAFRPVSKFGLRRASASKSALQFATMQATEKVITPDWRLAAFTLAGGAALTAKAPPVGLPFLALGALFAVQTNRVRFVFDDEAFSVKTSTKTDTGELGSTGENIVVGGENKWKYSSWVNYDFFPSKDFPILVYFKETQTPKEKWNEGPGQLDENGGGQIHFFPALCNVEEIDQEFKARGLRSERYNPM